VRKGQEHKELAADLDPDQTATMIVAMMEGLQLQWQMDKRVDMVAPFDAFLERIVAPRPRKPSTR